MDNLAIMDMLHAKAKLSEPVKDLSFCEVPAGLFFYLATQVTTFKNFSEFD